MALQKALVVSPRHPASASLCPSLRGRGDNPRQSLDTTAVMNSVVTDIMSIHVVASVTLRGFPRANASPLP